MSPSNSSSSISFLDLLTCGLGGILLLFFIVVASRKLVEFNARQKVGGQSFNEESVVIIHVATRSGEPLFEKPSSAWALQSNNQTIPHPKFVMTSIGTSFAVFYSMTPLPRGTTLWLTGLKEDADIESAVTDRFGTKEVNWQSVKQENGLIYSW